MSLTISIYTNTESQTDSEEALSNFVKGKGTIESKNYKNQSISQSAPILMKMVGIFTLQPLLKEMF